MALLGAPLLMGGACEKKTAKPDPGPINALERENGSASAAPIDTSPLQGIDLGKLEKDKQQAFYRLVGTLKSPCGKPESLRKSFIDDTSCKRSPFAVRFVSAMLEDEFPEDKIREDYISKYEKPRMVKLDVSRAPRVGTDDAPVKIVEFFDYACPHCKEFKPVLDALAQQYEGKITEYFMMYPLGHWPESKSAAMAAIAAHQQGKFKEMHALLFAKSPAHSKADVMGYAAQLGLDVAKFEAAYTAAAPQVEQDKVQGNGASVDSTPSVYFNDRKFEGPITVKYLGMWIEEELAVNR
ncbi:MAG: thioredoxin domain-containing protein [Deltaproteobacteria bacterium]|nr:thioredoxin domain-containing protein [Deltaproteobacteria bacterium]